MNSLLRVLSYLKPYRRKVILTLFLAVFTTLLDLVPPWLTKVIVDNLVESSEMVGVYWAIAGLASVYLARNFTNHKRIVVNNKVEQFDYKNFSKQLFSHYHDAGSLPVTKPQNLKRPKYRELFQLPGQLDDVFQVERNKDRADIMKLIFQIQEEYIDRLMARPGATRELIEKYCVAPFRSIYARVYRSTHSS